MQKATYKYRQGYLYAISRFILHTMSHPDYLPRFTAFKGKYTQAWVAARLAQIDEAEDTPDFQARSAAHENLRITLVQLTHSALHQFTALESYIREAFPANLLTTNIEAAGGNYYTAAAALNFSAAQQLLKSATSFAIENQTTLSISGTNMPATFPAELQSLSQQFKSTHTLFLQSETEAQTITNHKITLNNALHSEIVRTVNADAQVIFNKEEENHIRHQFEQKHQLYLVRGAGISGIRFHITNALTQQNIEQAEITIPSKSITLHTDRNGRALKLQLSQDQYQIHITHPAYQPFQNTIALDTVTVKRVNISLQPI